MPNDQWPMANKGPNPNSQGRGLIIIGHWRLSFTPGQRYSVGPDFRATIRFLAETRQHEQLLLFAAKKQEAQSQKTSPIRPGHTPVATPPPPLSVFRERVEGVGVRVIQNVERSPTSHLLSRERFAKRALSQNQPRKKELLWREARSRAGARE
jgi:hypothetical protein